MQKFFCVYILQSIDSPKEHYTGFSTDLKERLKQYNSGQSTHTNKFKPWKLLTYFAFSDKNVALDFEKYLKTGSGNAFLKKD